MSPGGTFHRGPGDTSIPALLCQDIPVPEDQEAEGNWTTGVRGDLKMKEEEGPMIRQEKPRHITREEAPEARAQGIPREARDQGKLSS